MSDLVHKSASCSYGLYDDETKQITFPVLNLAQSSCAWKNLKGQSDCEDVKFH